ncbi:class I SAM-dependent methyltransferase [Streptomyces sp. S465]|uniref:class I SAM-dependent methyltransferase n=1 Tax=Streptomyces sp. S465 TaxID=2979468 RepID=UPI003FCE06D5
MIKTRPGPSRFTGWLDRWQELSRPTRSRPGRVPDLVRGHARSVLDVGCGTGALLRRAREDGHTGRLCGLDPGAGMLEVARARPDVESALGDAVSARRWHREFDLVVGPRAADGHQPGHHHRGPPPPLTPRCPHRPPPALAVSPRSCR